jgi:hypothetical protein
VRDLKKCNENSCLHVGVDAKPNFACLFRT